MELSALYGAAADAAGVGVLMWRTNDEDLESMGIAFFFARVYIVGFGLGKAWHMLSVCSCATVERERFLRGALPDMFPVL